MYIAAGGVWNQNGTTVVKVTTGRGMYASHINARSMLIDYLIGVSLRNGTINQYGTVNFNNHGISPYGNRYAPRGIRSAPANRTNCRLVF